MTLNDTWGYKSYDNNWKSTATLIRNLVDIASKGGNYLLNVGPTSEGLIPAPSVERLKEIGQWMKVNGVAIYDTTASPFKSLPWGRCTKKLTADGAILYLHVFDWPADGKLLVPGLKNAAQRAYMLADRAQQPLAMQSSTEGLTLSLPAAAPDPVSSTIVLRVKGPLEIARPAWRRITTARSLCPPRKPACTAAKSNSKRATSATASASGPTPRIGPTGSSKSPGPASSMSPLKWRPWRERRSKSP